MASACEKTVSMDRSMSPGVGSKVFEDKKNKKKNKKKKKKMMMMKMRKR